MPLVRVTTTGSQIIASAQVSRRLSVTLTENTTTTISDLGIQVNNLPNVFIYIEQSAGALGANFTPLFAVDNLWNGVVSAPNWLKLTSATAIFPNVPAFFNFRIVANMITLSLQTPAAVGNYTFNCIVAASQ